MLICACLIAVHIRPPCLSSRMICISQLSDDEPPPPSLPHDGPVVPKRPRGARSSASAGVVAREQRPVRCSPRHLSTEVSQLLVFLGRDCECCSKRKLREPGDRRPSCLDLFRRQTLLVALRQHRIAYVAMHKPDQDKLVRCLSLQQWCIMQCMVRTAYLVRCLIERSSIDPVRLIVLEYLSAFVVGCRCL